MEPTENRFSLSAELNQWQQNMQNGSLTADDAAELSQHLSDEVLALQAKGLNEEEAWIIARKRIGQPVELTTEFGKVNPDFAASRNWLMVFWGATLFMILQTLIFIGPVMLRYIVIANSTDPRKVDPVINDITLKCTLWGFSVVLLFLLVINLTRANKISLWFNKLLVNHSLTVCILLVTIGSFLGFYNYLYVGHRMISGTHYGELTDAQDVLGSIFYGALIFSTIYFTIRYRQQDMRSFKLFANSLNWMTCIIAGLIFQLACQITYIIHIDAVSFITIFVLFGITGWVIGYSKKYILNLLGAQLGPLAIFVFGFSINPEARLFFFMIYLAALVSLAGGFWYSRKNSHHLQTA